MTSAVDILIERMKTNPDDFLYDGQYEGKMSHIRHALDWIHMGEKTRDQTELRWLPEEDFQRLMEGYREMMEGRWTAEVVRQVFSEENPFKAMELEKQKTRQREQQMKQLMQQAEMDMYTRMTETKKRMTETKPDNPFKSFIEHFK